MTVYVDWLMNHGWRLGPNCHMFTDSDDLTELHEMADKIGMKRSWLDVKSKHVMPHYDLVASRRARAVKAGAVEIKTREQFCKLLNDYRERNGMKRLGSY